MDRYAGWLHEQRYTWRSARYELRMAGRVANYFEGRGVCRIEDLSHHILMNAIAGFARSFMRNPAVFLCSCASFSKAVTLIDHHSHLPRIRRMFT
jgi:hypothetical protein